MFSSFQNHLSWIVLNPVTTTWFKIIKMYLNCSLIDSCTVEHVWINLRLDKIYSHNNLTRCHNNLKWAWETKLLANMSEGLTCFVSFEISNMTVENWLT